MGIYLPNMEMPKKCEIISIDKKGEVYIYGQHPTKLYKAVPVPPHGRLGDLDAVAKRISDMANCDWNVKVGASDGMLAALEVVEDAPTIISAEEEGET